MSEQTLSQVNVRDLGLIDYNEALAIQLREHERVVTGGAPVILLVEHPSVLTLGKNADETHLLLSRSQIESSGVNIVETDRGGEVTAHVPGQLVVYPILPITQLNFTPRSYVHALEEAVIKTLLSFNIQSLRDSEHPGVWVGLNKICAIGVRIKTRVAMHGLALNVNNSFDLFQKIVPCGIRFRGVTSMSQELDTKISIDAVKTKLVFELQNQIHLKNDKIRTV